MSQRLVKQNDSDDYYTVTIYFDCSQLILDTLVKAIYARKIDHSANNVKDILSLADFLQAKPVPANKSSQSHTAGDRRLSAENSCKTFTAG